MSFSKKIIAGVAAVATLATLAPAVAMAEGDAPATQQQTQAADASITVNSNGGTWAGGARGDVSASGKVGDKFATFASQLPTISRAGYTFAGYSRTKDGSSIISNNDVIIKNWTQLWVAWTKNDAKQFNVTVSTNGGTIADGDHKGEAGDIQVSAAQDSVLVNALPQVQRDGYLFAGWSYDKDGKSPVVATDFVSADTRVYAQWTKQKPVVDAKQFNVTVSTNGGTIADGDHKGEAGDIQVSAAQDSVLVNALPQVQRDGYLFAGWSYDKDGKSPVVATDFVSADTRVYAQWTKQKPVVDAKQFNVTVSTNGGTIADGDHKGEAGDIQVSAAQDSVLVNALPQVQRDGYLFAGWSYDKDGKSPVVATDFVSADTRVYAQWTKQKPVVDAKQFNVTVSTNGGTIADGDHKGEAGDIQVSAAQDSVLVNALPQVQRDGYLFAGWSYDKDGKSPVVATDFVSADTRVYAQWTKQKPVVDAKQFNVTVSTNGGTIADGDHKGEAGDIQVSAAQDSVLVNALPQVQRDGYLFAGWSYDKDGKSPVVATDFVSADTRVYAQWTKQKPVVDAKQFNVTVSTNGGTIADGDHKGEAGDIQVSAAQDSVLVNALPQVQRDGYLFAGWSYDKDGKSPVVATDFVSADTRVYAQWTKADDSKKDDSKPADTTKKNDTKGNTKKTVAQKIKKAVLGNTGATVGGVAAFAVLALLGFAGITVLRKRA